MEITNQALVEVFPPGEYIQEELEARGWLQSDLVAVLGVDKKTVSDIIGGKRSITPEMAVLIGEAFGTGPEVWLNLDNTYRLHNAQCSPVRTKSVSRKSELYSKYPVRLMANRGWLTQTAEIDALERELAAFFMPQDLGFAARRGGDETKEPLQLAWLYRAYHLAETLPAGAFSEIALPGTFTELRKLLPEPAQMTRIPSILAEAGVRFLLVEALPASLIDGVCFWLDSRSPVVALSTRLDRIDNFWFTLMHELMHVKYGHGHERAMLDVDIMGKKDGVPEEERLANEGASEFLVPQVEIDAFVAEKGPLYAASRVKEFATKLAVHPGLVVGRLQYIGAMDCSQHRGMPLKVRHFVAATAPHDGWGMVVPEADKSFSKLPHR